MSYPPFADMYPSDYLPTRPMTEAEAEWFADYLWEQEEDEE